MRDGAEGPLCSKWLYDIGKVGCMAVRQLWGSKKPPSQGESQGRGGGGGGMLGEIPSSCERDVGWGGEHMRRML